MPFLSDEEVEGLNKKIETLEESQEELEEQNTDYEEEVKKKKSTVTVLIVVVVIVLVALIVSVVFGFVLNKKSSSVSSELQEVELVAEETLDSIASDVEEVFTVEDNEVTYAVQIGVYEDFDVSFEESSDVRKIYKDDMLHYVLGNFSTEAEAENFRLIMLDLKVRKPFVVKIEHGELVEL